MTHRFIQLMGLDGPLFVRLERVSAIGPVEKNPFSLTPPRDGRAIIVDGRIFFIEDSADNMMNLLQLDTRTE